MAFEASVVIPVYKPRDSWKDEFIPQYKAFKTRLGKSCELIIVNDGSPEAEGQILAITEQIEDVRHTSFARNQGKGVAWRTGVEMASGKTVIITDHDLPYTTASMVDIYYEVKNGSDVALGNRRLTYYKKVPAVRKWLSVCLRFFLKTFLAMPVSDTQCGLKGFSIKGKDLFLKTEIPGFLIDMEFIVMAYKNPDLIKKAPEVKLREDVRFNRMSPKILLKEWLHLLNVIQLRFGYGS